MTAWPYIYRWNYMGRKGHRCRVTARGRGNRRIVFEDGHVAIVPGGALRKAKLEDYDAVNDGLRSYEAAIAAKRERAGFRIVSPAPKAAVLELSGAAAAARRRVLAQARAHETAAVFRGHECLAIATFDRSDPAATEMALSIAPAAARCLKRLVRMAQLTLSALAETAPVVVSVRPGHRAGERMAAATGFRPSGLPGFWVFREGYDDKTTRRRRLEGGGGAAAPAADGGQRAPAFGAEGAGTA